MAGGITHDDIEYILIHTDTYRDGGTKVYKHYNLTYYMDCRMNSETYGALYCTYIGGEPKDIMPIEFFKKCAFTNFNPFYHKIEREMNGKTKI